MGRPAALLLLLLAFVHACAPRAAVAPSPPSAPAARLLVVGDVQLASAFKARPSLESWRAPLDTTELAARMSEAVRDAQPTDVVQMGDLVDLNEAAVLELAEGGGARRVPQGFEEWRPALAAFPRDVPLFPVVGNHERYGELVVPARADGDALDVGEPRLTHFATPAEVHAALRRHFPRLEEAAQFHGQAGSYLVVRPRFCLLSIDGADLDDDPSLFAFVAQKLAACRAARRPSIVACHYPLFSGRARKDDASLELAKHRDRLLRVLREGGAALVLAGHEHFYLRYLPEGLARAGYEDPGGAVHVTVASFANPYPRSFARLDANDPGVRTFRGTHYAVVTLDDAGIRMTVRGYRDGRWHDVDEVAVVAAGGYAP